MRTLFAMVVIGGLLCAGVSPEPVVAAPLDGSVPMLCAFSSVFDCSRGGECERSTPEEEQVPPFMRINVQQRVIGSIDGARTSPITAVQRTNDRLMIQGLQNERVWGAVINEQTGRMSATVVEDDGVIVLSGACIAP